MSGDSSLGIGIGLALKSYGRAFRGLLNEYPGAAAAYSLRKLSGAVSNVVRVRRASDNDEKDFTALQVSSGELTNWVNSQTVPPLDIGVETSEGRIPVPEGGTSIGTPAAAYSLRNLSTTYTGNVVDVRRSSDDAEESFTAAEVADGTLEAWVGVGFDGFVSKWYDQSGNDNHATQGTDASQPKIVNGGSLVSGGIDFDGVDDGLFTASNFTDTLQSATIFALTQDDVTSGRASMVRIRPNGLFGTVGGVVWEKLTDYTYGPNTFIEGDNGAVTAALSGQGTRNTSKNLNTLVYQQSQILAYENGALDETLNDVESGSVPVGDVTLVDQLWLGQNFDDNARPFNGTMSEVIVYFTDQSDNRTAIEANIGETYGITGIPAYDNTVDGFVETWYDQSGNGIDQTQSVASNQPQIVNNGALMTDAIYFGDGTFALIGGDTDVSVSSGVTVHCVLNGQQVADITGGIGNVVWSLTDDTEVSDSRVGLFRNGISDNLQVFLRNAAGTQTRVLTYSNFFQTYDGVDTLITTVFDVTANGMSVYINGSLATPDSTSGTYDNDVTADFFSIGSYGNVSTAGRLDQNGVREALIDPSVDGTRRDGIMANIKSQYNIA